MEYNQLNISRLEQKWGQAEGRRLAALDCFLFAVQRLAEVQSGLGTGLPPSTAPLRFLAGPWLGEETAIDQGLWSCP